MLLLHDTLGILKSRNAKVEVYFHHDQEQQMLKKSVNLVMSIYMYLSYLLSCVIMNSSGGQRSSKRLYNTKTNLLTSLTG